MTLGHAAVVAGLGGLSFVLPISESGHRAVAALWLGAPRDLEALAMVGRIGCLLAVVLVVRQRLGQAFSEGIRGIARPAKLQSSSGGRDAVAIVVASVAAAVLGTVLGPILAPWATLPMAVGTGLLSTAIALMSVGFAPPPGEVSPGALGALVAGLAYGLASAPGASQVGAAFVVLCWLGVARWRAAELALLISVPVTALELARYFLDSSGLPPLELAQVALTVLLSFIGAMLAASWWRALCERERTKSLALWLVPLSLATIAYGRALPYDATTAPAAPPLRTAANVY